MTSGGCPHTGITTGCNPPVGDRYCPTSPLTRGELAAFVRRSLDLPSSPSDAFTDDEESIFEDDIDALAAAGITRGCNPPDNTDSADPHPDQGRSAALLHRALELPSSPPMPSPTTRNRSSKTTSMLSQLQDHRGCNPPDNTQLLPDPHPDQGRSRCPAAPVVRMIRRSGI